MRICSLGKKQVSVVRINGCSLFGRLILEKMYGVFPGTKNRGVRTERVSAPFVLLRVSWTVFLVPPFSPSDDRTNARASPIAQIRASVFPFDPFSPKIPNSNTFASLLITSLKTRLPWNSFLQIWLPFLNP